MNGREETETETETEIYTADTTNTTHGSHSCNVYTKHSRCTRNCPRMLRLADRAKTELGGRLLAMRLIGLESERKKKSPAVTSPFAVICRSPCFSPRKYKAVIMYADTRQFNARSLNTCMVVTRVQRPCRRTDNTESMEVRRAVKGEAMDASPSFTIVGSASCCCSSASARDIRSFLHFYIRSLLLLQWGYNICQL